MGVVTGIVLYIVIWWVVIFAILPWGVRPPKRLIPGQSPGAPDNPRLMEKFLINTVLSGVIWCGVYYLITREIFDINSISIVEIKR